MQIKTLKDWATMQIKKTLKDWATMQIKTLKDTKTLRPYEILIG